jgi:hypothetical protein
MGLVRNGLEVVHHKLLTYNKSRPKSRFPGLLIRRDEAVTITFGASVQHFSFHYKPRFDYAFGMRSGLLRVDLTASAVKDRQV